MNINSTLVGQAIAFAIFVMFCMKFVWPPLIGAINERQRKIAEGLNAAEKAKADLATAEQDVQQELDLAKTKAAALIEQANKSANQLVEDAKRKPKWKASAFVNKRKRLSTKKSIKRVSHYVPKLLNWLYLVQKRFCKTKSMCKNMPVC